MRKTAIMIVVLLGLAVLILRLGSWQAETSDPGGQAAGPVVTAPTGPETAATASQSPAEIDAAIARVLGKRLLPRSVFDAARDGDLEAAQKVHRTLTDCKWFIEPDWFEALYQPEEKFGAGEQRLRYLTGYRDHCTKFAGFLNPAEHDPSYWEDILEQGNHPVMKVKKTHQHLDLGETEKADEIALQVIASKHPDAIASLMEYVGRRWNDRLLEDWQPDTDLMTYRNAMTLLLCELDWSKCDPYGPPTWTLCSAAGSDCDPGIPFPEQLNRFLGEDDYRRVAELYLSFSRNLASQDFRSLLLYLNTGG